MSLDKNANEIVDTPLRGRWWISAALAAGALGLYLATLSRGVFPGMPAKNLVWHLHLDAFPTLLDPVGGWLVRQCGRFGGEALGSAVLSAVCGALCVFFLSALMMRVRYTVHEKEDPGEVAREEQARRLAGIVSGIALAVSVPVWVHATRSMPGTFHLLLLLVATWLFSEYQREGKTGTLWWFGFVYGIGIPEFATFILFAPLAAILVARAMLQRASFRWSTMVGTALCALPPMIILYILNGSFLWNTDPSIPLHPLCPSLPAVIWRMMVDQWRLIAGAPMMILLFAMTALPWMILYLIRSKKAAWRYNAWQTLLRLAVLAAACAAIFNTAFSPWHFFGMAFPLVTPYLILAICAGTVAGEFWVMGQSRDHKAVGIGQPLRKVCGTIALLLPAAFAVAGVLNAKVADGRAGTKIAALLDQTVESLADHDLVLSTGVLDDALRVAAHEHGAKLRVISMPAAGTETYLKFLSETAFKEPRQRALLQVGFGAFIQDYLANDAHLIKTAAIDSADLLREYGYLVPDGLVSTAVPTPDRADWNVVLGERLPAFRGQMEALQADAADPRNPIRPYEQYVLRLASKTFNNVGFARVEAGDKEGAVPYFETARALYPDNISALLNLLTLARDAKSPSLEPLEADWKALVDRGLNNRVMQSLGHLYGYVYNTGYLVRNGMMWAVSGRPRMAEAELRRAAGGQSVDPAAKAFLARAFLATGDRETSAQYFREALENKPGDPSVRLKLAEIAMSEGDLDAAQAQLDALAADGVPAEALAFDRIVMQYLGGDADGAVLALKERTAKHKQDVRAWSFLAYLTGDGSDPETYERALKAIKSLRGASPETRLLLAELYSKRHEWGDARAELEQVLRLNPRLVKAWEMLVAVDFGERKRDLAEDHVRALLTLDPSNHEGNLMLGSFQYERGQYSLAAASYRTALEAKRTPTCLNDLAYILIGEGSYAEAEQLIDEACAMKPDDPLLLSTRGELYLRTGRLDEAETDIQQVLSVLPDNLQMQLLAAELYHARGQDPAARQILDTLRGRVHEFPADLQARLQDLLRDVP